MRIANRYRTECNCCGAPMPPNSGTVEKIGRKWLGTCAACAADGRTAGEDHGLRALTDVDRWCDMVQHAWLEERRW